MPVATIALMGEMTILVAQPQEAQGAVVANRG
jgi:hypothetical protein